MTGPRQCHTARGTMRQRRWGFTACRSPTRSGHRVHRAARPAVRRSGTASQAFDRTPPQDIAAEQCVLGGMLLSKDAIADVVEILRSATTSTGPAHATVFDTVLDLYGRGEPADAITVAAALTDAGDLARIGGAAYLHTLISSVPTAANSSYYARIVAERAVLRRLVEAGTRIVAAWGTARPPARVATSTTSSTWPSRPSTT